jgi:hypothetical protein
MYGAEAAGDTACGAICGGLAMTFEEILGQIWVALQHEQRISYRALQRRFALEDTYLEDIKEELIYATHLARDEDGRVLVWRR